MGFSIVAARKMAQGVLPGDPSLSRRRLLSTLPARMRPMNLEKLRDPLQLEQGTMLEEKYMLEDAADASVKAFLQEQGLQMDKHGRRKDHSKLSAYSFNSVPDLHSRRSR